MARPLRPVAAAFVLFGAFWGAWAIAAADLERELGLSHGGLGLLLSVGLIGATAANALGGSLTERVGTGRLLAMALAAWGGLLVVCALVRWTPAFVVLLIVAIGVGGLVDVVMNVAAAAALSGRPGALVRFHAGFNVGAALGAGATGLAIGHGLSWRWGWAAAGAIALGMAVVLRRSPMPAGAASETTALTGALGLLRAEGLVLVAVAFGLGAMVEGGIDLWGVLYLRTHVASGLVIGATSGFIAYTVAALARLVFGPIVGSRGAAKGVAAGAGAAAAGIVVLVLAPGAWLAGAGLVLAAGGIALCWPLLLAHASAGRKRPGAIVGAVSTAGYLGLVSGPAIVGWLAGGVGLRGALLVLAAAAGFVALAPIRRTSPMRAPR